MAKIIIYSKATCPYCDWAKLLLDKKQVSYDEIRVDTDPSQRAIMEQRSGRRTVPQIFINDKPIGGYDDLSALNQSGELDKLLSS
jgi:glutaredoxin 3